MIEAKIICDSMSPNWKRLTTLQLRYPRFIHAELMTHRVFSRNASSSRAIPVARMIEDLRRDPAMPVYWGSNKQGMQAGEELSESDIDTVKGIWLNTMENSIHSAEKLMECGLHKQIANRILEPWAHINVVVTATEWNNFWMLRRHPDAQPEIKELADAMYLAMVQSIPAALDYGAWHLPYIRAEDWVTAVKHLRVGRITRDMPNHQEQVELLKKVSTARCARVSYLTHDGRETTVEEDLELFERLVRADVIHASPLEHAARPDVKVNGAWTEPHLHANFTGWCQFRKTIPGEYVAG